MFVDILCNRLLPMPTYNSVGSFMVLGSETLIV